MSVATPTPEVAEAPEEFVDLRREPGEPSFDVHAWVRAFAPRLHEPVEMPTRLMGVPLS